MHLFWRILSKHLKADETAIRYANFPLVHQWGFRLPIGWRDSNPGAKNETYLDVVSLWESICESSLHKLPLPCPPASYLSVQREHHQIVNVPRHEASVRQLITLPTVHRDPFDRMLIYQAIEHMLTIVTADEEFQAYPAPILGRG